MQPTSLMIADLQAAYRSGLKPAQFFSDLLDAIDAAPANAMWITRLSREDVLSRVARLEDRSLEELPLYGVPFAIKDNIDLAGVPTTAACPDFAYTPSESAFVVQCLIDAGAIPLGKTNLDQFAAGLNGTRSPYGACANSFSPLYVSGGSSSGSSIAVAQSFVSFALGTDTAGSGRVPAGFNNIVGLKPSCGRLSTRGVLPACRSLDCISIFAMSTDCASRVLAAAGRFDATDAYARELSATIGLGRVLGADRLRVGVPRKAQLQFHGDAEYARLFDAAVERFVNEGAEIREIDYAPFIEAAQLLYHGPWIAERYVAIREFFDRHPDSLYPVTRSIIEGGRKPTAVDTFTAQYRLAALRRVADQVFATIDVILTPTAPTIYRIDEMLENPIELNTRLGYYTNHVNLLDLAGLAIPAGFRRDGMPFGVTLVGPAGYDEALLVLGARMHPLFATTVGATNHRTPSPVSTATLRAGFTPIVVCGAHMRGMPLNSQLRERHAYFLRDTQTAAVYRFYALSGGPPKRPGLVRVEQGGAAIEVEVWAIPTEHLGSFVAAIPSPLGIGTVQLADGTEAPGFVCEAIATKDAQDITELRGWRAFIDSDGSAIRHWVTDE